MKIDKLLLLLFLSTCLSRIIVNREKRGVWFSKTNIWSNKTIPFKLNAEFKKSELFSFNQVLKTIEEESCVKFVPYNKAIHNSWLTVEKLSGCWSQIGMLGSGEQFMSLDVDCRTYSTMFHEMMHTLGFLHEHQRPDRHQYIKVYEENIKENETWNFQIDDSNVEKSNSPFDFQSVTLYSPYGLSKNGLPVWVKLNKNDTTGSNKGQRDLSFWDALDINKMYQCADHCSKSIECKQPGFINKNCQCQTVEDYAERRCKDNKDYEHICQNATTNNFCYKKPHYASVICRKTCGRCFTYGSFGNSKRPNYYYACSNIDDNECENQKKRGGCFLDTWTLMNCRKACGFCSKHHELPVFDGEDIQAVDVNRCKDSYDTFLCDELVGMGICSINKAFMQSNCAFSCNFCQINTTDNVTETKICRNYASDSYCDVSAKRKSCNERTIKICMGSCGKCGEYYEKNEIYQSVEYKKLKELWATKCEDKNNDCKYYYKAGKCQSYYESMKYHCPNSCGLCDPRCVNILSWDICLAIKQKNMCQTHPDWARRCRKTCGLCHPTKKDQVGGACVDTDSVYMCNEVVRNRLCIKGIGCNKSCGFCTDHSQTESVVLNETDDIDMCKDVDLPANCDNLKLQKQCYNHVDRAILCKKTCDLCPLPTTISPNISTTTVQTTTSEPCEDKFMNGECYIWSRAGYCQATPKYMESYCAKTCGLCNKGTKENKGCGDKTSTETCEAWKANGYCTHGHIVQECRNTCNGCRR